MPHAHWLDQPEIYSFPCYLRIINNIYYTIIVRLYCWFKICYRSVSTFVKCRYFPIQLERSCTCMTNNRRDASPRWPPSELIALKWTWTSSLAFALKYLRFVPNQWFCVSVAHDEAVPVGLPPGRRLELRRDVLGPGPSAWRRHGCARLRQPDLSHEEALLQ